MPERQYEKYILDSLKVPESVAQRDEELGYAKRATRVLWLEDEIMQGASSIICSWYWKPSEPGTPAHTHDFDEIIGFIGNDPENPRDLGAEVELWLEDDKHILTKTCMVYVPKGMRHCPLQVLKVDYPIVHFTIFTSGGEAYLWKDVD